MVILEDIQAELVQNGLIMKILKDGELKNSDVITLQSQKEGKESTQMENEMQKQTSLCFSNYCSSAESLHHLRTEHTTAAHCPHGSATMCVYEVWKWMDMRKGRM